MNVCSCETVVIPNSIYDISCQFILQLIMIFEILCIKNIYKGNVIIEGHLVIFNKIESTSPAQERKILVPLIMDYLSEI